MSVSAVAAPTPLRPPEPIAPKPPEVKAADDARASQPPVRAPCRRDRERGSIRSREGDSVVIARESGRPSIPPVERSMAAGDYWIPAFAGMTTICDRRTEVLWRTHQATAASSPKNTAIMPTPAGNSA